MRFTSPSVIICAHLWLNKLSVVRTKIGQNAWPASISLPSGMTEIGMSSFSGCTGLKSIDIPSSVDAIGDSAFYNCSALTSITFPEGVKEIGEHACHLCSGLKTVSIPSSVTSIKERAFLDCNSVTAVYSYIQSPFEVDHTVFGSVRSATLYVPKGTKELYAKTDYWSYFTTIVEME